jgi:type II secretory pathway predicted ATPase ExeA
MTIALSFFGVEEHSSNQTADPRVLHLTPGHREAIAQLVYGAQRRTGFILLTGETGTGKTTLLQALLRKLDDRTAVAFLANSILGFEGREASKIAGSLLRHHQLSASARRRSREGGQ